MFSTTTVLARLRADEGYRSRPYLCSSNVWTFGYGTTHYNGYPVTQSTPPISIEEARKYLRADAFDAITVCQSLYTDFSNLYSIHQEVLILLAYQLGRTGLTRFVKMNEAINGTPGGDIEGFARELKDSTLYRTQARGRVIRYLHAILQLEWLDT